MMGIKKKSPDCYFPFERQNYMILLELQFVTWLLQG